MLFGEGDPRLAQRKGLLGAWVRPMNNSNGVYPIAVSGYRTAVKQQSLMEEKIAEYEAEGCSASCRCYLCNYYSFYGNACSQGVGSIKINSSF